MHKSLRGVILVTLFIGVPSCIGSEYMPTSSPEGADGGWGGLNAPNGITAGVAGIAIDGGGRVATDGGRTIHPTAGTSGAEPGGGTSLVIGGSSAGAGWIGNGGVTGQGGSTGAGGSSRSGSWTAVAGARSIVYDCGMPAPGSGGVAKPTGIAGNLKVLDWAGFKAATTFTFDDANSSQIQHYAELKALGVPLTFFLWTSRIEALDPTWARAVLDGHELGNHTKSHFTTATAADIDAATSFITQHFGVNVWTMAAPYGNSSYAPLAQTRFLANRGVASGYITPNGNADPFQLPCYLPPQGALASAINSVLDSSRSAGAWQIVLVHGFTGGTDAAYQPVSISEFTASVAHTKSWGDVWIGSMVDVTAYWRAQKMFSAVTPTVSGTDRTWTWILPEHFPPGKCLRVSVDGGTLKQAGAPLPWNEHGYYDVSLDQGSLTLSSGNETTNTGGTGNTSGGTSGEGAAGGTSLGGADVGAGGSISFGGSDPGAGGDGSLGGADVGAGGSISFGGSDPGAGGDGSLGGADVGAGGDGSLGGADVGAGGDGSLGGADVGVGGDISFGGSDVGPGGSSSLGGADGGSSSGASNGGSGGSAAIAATGVIQLIVPLAAEGQAQGFEVYHLSPPLDLNGATVTARVYAPDALNGNFTLWFSSPGGVASEASVTAFTELGAGYFAIEVAVPAADGIFDPTRVDLVHLDVQTTGSGPWQTPATLLYLDSLVSSNGALSDTFDTSPDPALFVQSELPTVAESSFTWLPNYP